MVIQQNMLQRRDLFLLFLILFLVFQARAGEMSVQTSVNDSVAIEVSQDEIILYNMINDMRRQGKMQPIPLSSDLCIVAHTHIEDLIKWKPQEKGRSLQSWSNSGNWTSCDDPKDPSGIKCMKSKPKEITGYPGNGYELIFWGEDKATPADAADLWQQVEASSDMILCRGKWKGFQWKALGVGLKDGYAVLWLGDKIDKKSHESNKNESVAQVPDTKEHRKSKPESEEKTNIKSGTENLQKENSVNEEINTQTVGHQGVRYFLIVSSLKTSEAAKSELQRYISKGYPDAFILESESVYRIVIKSFDSETKAKTKLRELRNDFPGIWIFKK
jgi:hypothetical protein